MTQISTDMAISCPAWSISGYLEVRDGHLNINGADALDLVGQYDSPLFVFSEPRIRDNIARLQHAASVVDRPIKFCYASKANSNMAILKTVLESGIDVEVNSGGELFKAMTGTFILHVPYRGSPQAINDLIAGEVHLMFDNISSIGAHARSGRVRGIAVSGARRSPLFPDLPTLHEAGVTGYETSVW